jgi:hypothetical protein
LFLSNFSEDKIIASFELCIEANNVTFDPNFVVNREEKDKPKQNDKPTFKDPPKSTRATDYRLGQKYNGT